MADYRIPIGKAYDIEFTVYKDGELETLTTTQKLWCTLKRDLSTADTATGNIRKGTSAAGLTGMTVPAAGSIVNLAFISADSSALTEDTVYQYDCQLLDAGGQPRRFDVGTVTFFRTPTKTNS